MKFALKNYWKPTPKHYRVLGDSILYVGGIATTVYVGTEMNSQLWILLFVILLGKFLSNWFIEEKK